MSVIVSTLTTRRQQNLTTHTVGLPSGRQVGDTIVLLIRLGADSNTVSNAGGFTVARNGNSHFCLTRVVDGTEADEVSITFNWSQHMVAIAYLLRGVAQVHVSTTTVSSSTNTAYLNPPLLSVATTMDYLALAVVSTRRTDNLMTAAPTGYGGLVQISSTNNNTSTDSGECRIASAHRLINGNSEDPNAFTTAGTSNLGRSFTILVEIPAATLEITETTRLQSTQPLTITGTSFGAAQGDNGQVLLSPTDDPADPGAVVQPIDWWEDTSIIVEAAELPTGAVPGDTLYLFVTNNAEETTDGFAVPVANLALRVPQLLRDTDSGAPINENVDVLVFSTPVVGAGIKFSAAAVAITAGVLEFPTPDFLVSEIGNTLYAALIGADNRSALVPAVVVDLNDE